jgi:polar amino acid transport system substrate-binding protein
VRRAAGLLAAAAATAVGLAGCSQPSAKATPKAAFVVPSAPVSSPVAAPRGLVTPGKLTVASDLSYPPQESLDRKGAPVGFDIDLARAIAHEMNLGLVVVNLDVNGIVPGFAQADHHYDFGISAMPDTPSLEANAHVMPYFTAGQAILVGSANPRHVAGLATLCGLNVGAQRSSSGEDDALRLNEKTCAAKPTHYQVYDRDLEGIQDVASGKLDAFLEDYPVAVYLSQQIQGVRVVPHQFSDSVDVAVFPLTDTAVQAAVSAAFSRLRKNGVYAALLAHWDLSEGTLP